MSPAEYRALLSSGKPLPGSAPISEKRDDPEHQFQCLAVECLFEVLPAEIIWTADAAGVRVTPKVARKMKEAGVQRGWPDMRFLFPDAVTRYIENKAKTGSLRPDQKVLRNRLEPKGYWAMARTWAQIYAALERWCAEAGLTLLPLPKVLAARVRQFEREKGLA